VHIQPGRPIQNGRVESFHGKLRDECLRVSWFGNLRSKKPRVRRRRARENPSYKYDKGMTKSLGSPARGGAGRPELQPAFAKATAG